MYHVTLRGNHQQDIFFAPADRHRLSALFARVLGQFDARLHAYCYMTNHIHALIQVAAAPLGSLIMRVAGQYARMTQSSLQTTGHLFEKRYHAVLVDVDQYFLTLLRYIHLNPVEAGLAKSPDQYPWSSHHAYIGARIEPWVTTDFGLSQFSGDRDRAIHAYRTFVAASTVDAASSPLQECHGDDQRILGSDAFANSILGSTWKPKSRKTLHDLIREACDHFHCRPGELQSKSRKSNLVAARAWVTREAVNGRIASIAEVGRSLNRDESSLRHALQVHNADVEVFPVSRPGTK